MVRNVATLCTLLLAIHHHVLPSLAANNIGCLFSNTLCEQEREWCYDDHAFGRCLSSYSYTSEDLHRYELGSEELRVLEQEMQRLFLLGYRWSHTYTQCVLQAILDSIRHGTLSTERNDEDEDGKPYDISSCNGDLDQDLEGALRAIEGEELVDPRDLAIVRFTPSATDPHSDYADEVYFPPIKDPHHQETHPDQDQDGEEGSEEEGGEEGTGGRGMEDEGDGGGGRGREEDGGDEDNSLSPIPSHNLPPHPPPPDTHPPPPHQEDDRAQNYISFYDEPVYQNDVYQSPYDFQHNPVFGKRSYFNPRPRPDPDESLQLNYQPFIRKYSGGMDDRSSERNGLSRFRAQESVVFPSRFREQQTQQDEGVFGEAPVRPMYAEGGMQIIPPLEKEHDLFGQDDEVDDEGGMWSNNPAELRASPAGIPGFGDQQSLSDDTGNLRGFLDQGGIPSELRNMPGERHGFSKQQSLLENLRGFDDQPSLDDVRGYGERGNIPGDLRNLPESLRNFAEQQSGIPEALKNMPGNMRSLPVDVPGFAEQQYLPYEEPQEVWPYQSDARSYADPRTDEWSMPSFVSQRGPMDFGLRNVKPSVFGDLRNYGERRTFPEDLKNMGGFYPPTPWNAPPRYRDLSRVAPLMMVADEDPPEVDTLTGYESVFGPQIVDPVYGQQLFDYQDDYQDYSDYQDYDQDYDRDPRHLTQKFVKKDEETVGGDYGDFSATGWNLPRAERLDVKKPGPYFRSANNFAFESPLFRQREGVSFLMASLQDSGMGKEPPPQASDSLVPDLLLAERGYVDLAEESATDKAASEQEEEQKGEEKEEEEEEEDEEKGKTSTEEEEEEEEGGGEEKAALVSPSPKDVDLVEITVKEGMDEATGRSLVSKIGQEAGITPHTLQHFRVEGNTVEFSVNESATGLRASHLARLAEKLKEDIEKELGVEIVDIAPHEIKPEARVAEPTPTKEVHARELRTSGVGQHVMAAAAVVCGVAAAVAVAAGVLFLLRRHANSKAKLPLLASPNTTQDSKDYADVCRARMAGKGGVVEGVKVAEEKTPSSGHAPSQRVSSLSKDSDNGNNSPSSRSSTSSWSEEPVASNMDISTGHMVLSYMEDHLKNKDRLEQEWIALCAYEAEPCATTIALKPENSQKNRYPDAVPYDHNRVLLNAHANISGSDYINASSITDHDPRNPAYIATQGPLETTAADFWQLVWEQGSVVIVMLTRLTENGHSFCYRYWPEEGSDLYHIYEVHLVSEHIWCDDYLVRSFYLKNVRTGETRTVTQFHFLSWHESGTPASTKALLEFRRKVNKSYRGRSCPIIVHCSDGIGRTGTYCLIDMVLNRMAKGAKEIDIAATLEHIRDQRPHMVRSKPQFEFVLMAVAEEVHAILKALPQ